MLEPAFLAVKPMCLAGKAWLQSAENTSLLVYAQTHALAYGWRWFPMTYG